MIVRQFFRFISSFLVLATFTVGVSLQAQAQSGDVIAEEISSALGKNDAASLSALFSDDYVDQSKDFLGDGELLRQLNELAAVMPEARVELTVLEDSDGVIAIGRKIEGMVQQDFLGHPPPPVPVLVETMDFFTVENGKIKSRRGLMDKIGLLRQLTMPFPANAPSANTAVHEVIRFNPGEFPEGLIDNGEGGLLLTMLFDNKILTIAPDGGVDVFADLPFAADPKNMQGVMCIAKNKDNAIYITVQSRTPEHHGLWRLNKDGAAQFIAPMPQGSIPNGLDVDDKGRVYVADSSGAVWQWQPDTSKLSVWADDSLVRRRPFIGNFPGPNGLKVKNNYVYVTVSDTGAYVRIPIRKNGRAGDTELIAHGAPGDDFAIDSNGDAYITTHPFNSVLKVTEQGVEEVVANHEDGVIGPTSAAFVETADGPELYVVTDGGLYAPIPGVEIVPKLLRIDID